jgi:GPH family glycoside/pentoside/hexuronide:cation symporter
MVAASLIAGCASGCAPTLGQALKADLIDRDELATGERKEGAYFAAWNLVSKLASGVMIGLVGFALDLSGFVAGVEEQSAAAIRTMVFLCGGMPVLGFAVGMWLFRGFGLTQDEHARVLAALSRRAPGSVMPEPPDAEGSR